jgi:WhiB family redox-sensing transcriptional regulator
MNDGLFAWQDQANCRTVGVDMFFPLNYMKKSGQVQQAIAVCNNCTVRVECLNYAIETESTEGIFGGLTPKERAAA